MPEYMNPATGALFNAPVGGNYRGSVPRPQNQLANRGAFATPQDRSAFLSDGIGQWQAQQRQQASVASNVQLPSQPLSADKGAYGTAQQRNVALSAGVHRAQATPAPTRVFSDNMRGGFSSGAARNSALNSGVAQWQAQQQQRPAGQPAPAALPAQRPTQNVNMSRSFNPTPDDERRRGNVDFFNGVRESGLQGAAKTTQPNPLYGPKSGSMANHPVNVFAREQALTAPKPTQNRAGLGADLVGPRRAAAVATRSLGGLPGGLPAMASAPAAPVPQHGMQASAPPGARPRVPTAPSGIAIEDPFSSKPAVAQRPTVAPAGPARPAPAVAQNPAVGGRRGRMQENRE